MPVCTGWFTDSAPNDSGREFLHRIRNVALNRPFAVDRLTERIDHAPEQTLSDRHLQEFARCTNFVTLLKLRVVAEDNYTDFSLFEIQTPGR